MSTSFNGRQAGDTSGTLDAARSVGDAMRRLAETNPASPALLAPGFKTCSFGDLREQIEVVGASLHAWGLDQNARIGLSLSPAPMAALAMLAVGSWAQVIPLDPNAPAPEVASQLSFVQANAVVVPKGMPTSARAAAIGLRIPIIEASSKPGRLDLQLAMSAPVTRRAAVEPDLESILYILQTSGTTGDPKHVPWTHRNQFAVTERLQRALQLGSEDRALVILPIHHSFGANTLWTAILTGGSVAFPSDPLRFDLAEWLGALRPTWYRAVPAQHLFILDNLRSVPSTEIPRYLRMVVTGAAVLPDEARKGLWEVLGFPVIETYGCSEAGFICGNLPTVGGSRPGTVGRPDDGVVVVVGDDGCSLPAGEAGEILLGGATVCPGYVNAPELNRKAFVDGWYRTGDVGSVDEDGFLTLRGRLKDVISRGAEKVYPPEVEEILRNHPQVRDAAVFGVPHERLGEEVAAAIVLYPGESVKPAELRKFLGARLGWAKIPRRMIFLPDLPKGPTGKVMRQMLQERIAQEGV